MSTTYPDLPGTVYPDGPCDTFVNKKDADANIGKIIAQYKARFNNGNYTQAQTILDNNPGLADYMITANDFNKLQDAIMAVQRVNKRDRQQVIFSSTQPSGANAQIVGDIWIKTSASGATMYELTASGKYEERRLLAETSQIDAQIDNLKSQIGERRLKTYTSFEQLGLSVTKDSSTGYLTAAPSLWDTFNHMPDYSVFILLVNGDNFNLLTKTGWGAPKTARGNNATNGYIELTRIGNGRARLIFWCTNDDHLYINGFNGKQSDGTAASNYKWDRVLTTANFDFNSGTGTLNITL